MAEDRKDRLDQIFTRLSALEKKLNKLKVLELEIQEVNAALQIGK